ncbi:MAG: transposase [Pedosphaera sp.]|nr:transposase [Pedosphaera sp.]
MGYNFHMRITPDLFEAYLQCPTKCWLKSVGEHGAGNVYAEWVQARNESYRTAGLDRVCSASLPGECVTSPAGDRLKEAKWRLATDVLAQTQNLESRLHALECVPSEGRGRSAQLIPIRFIFTNKLTRTDKLLVAFDALVLSEMLNRDINLGKIIHGDYPATLKVKTPALEDQVRQVADKLAALLSTKSPPDLVLNRHCAECEFRGRCRQKAIEGDDLSLLAGMIEKERNRYRSKGIFTITQLSHTFRPRRPRKRNTRRQEKYHPALTALALRERKIHIVGNPELKLDGTPVYLDVEGIPDRDFYYLIGARVETRAEPEYHSFWADAVEDEGRIWADFLQFLANIQNPTLVHYGRFESVFLQRMCNRYGNPAERSASVAKAIEQPFNLLSFIFAQVYFPTYSNGLKDIGTFIGAKWQQPGASGLQSLLWRHRWEETCSENFKQLLLTYNFDDCSALCLLTSELKQIIKLATSRPDVDFAYAPKKNATESGLEIHDAFDGILASAWLDYQRSRIHIKNKHADVPEVPPRPKRISPIRARDFPTKRSRIVRVSPKRKCSIHTIQALQTGDEMAEHTIVDLVFTKKGCKKVLTTYVGKQARCPICGRTFLPPAIVRLGQRIFGYGFMAWVVYQRIALRLPVGVISRVTHDLFSEEINRSSVSWLISRAADDYQATETLLWQQILRSPVIQVDETKMNIRGSLQFAWVLTDGKHVVFRLTVTRESLFLQELLAGYQGTLVSDFYGGYDAMPCRQQKCLVHLIRDLNDDLWKNPFNAEYESFLVSVRSLLVPILEDVDRFGLKARHLRKHKQAVERFYKRTINGPAPMCEITATYYKRFTRYRESLFTFLSYDGIPWHNNVAECALRHLAVQRKISGFFFSKGAKYYLRLLGIAQTCRFQNKSFLGFLLSGCADLDQYKEQRRRKSPEDPAEL